jgi:hypothetical protein
MSDTTDPLADKVKKAAKKAVGSPALKSDWGVGCFALPDRLLREAGAQSAHDGEVLVDDNVDYDWGDPVELQEIRPGYILQFRDHVIERKITTTEKNGDSPWRTRTSNRPHHSAIVVEVTRKDGKVHSVTIVEQGVDGDPNVVSNVIPWLAEGELREEHSKDKQGRRVTTAFKVTGKIWAYRPIAKRKKASLERAPAPVGERRMFARFIPSQGGPKRPQGPTGMEPPRPKGPDASVA